MLLPGLAAARVEGTFAEAVLLETLALSRAQPRLRGRRGGRRDDAAPPAARPLHRDGLAAHARGGRGRGGPRGLRGRLRRTSNLEAGAATACRPPGPPRTPSRCCTTTRRGVRRAGGGAGRGTTLLVDTYDVEAAVRDGRRGGRARSSARSGSTRATCAVAGPPGPRPARRPRRHRTRILVTGDLDEYAIAGARRRAGRRLRGRHVAGHRLGRADRRPGLQAGGPRGRVGDDGAGGEGVAREGERTAAARRPRARRAGGRAGEEVLVIGTDDRWPPGRRSDAARPARAAGGRRRGLRRVDGGPRAVAGRPRRGTAASRDELPRGALRLSADEAAVPTVD